jgi:NMD protein affecting ribosome stability and mRNA decay
VTKVATRTRCENCGEPTAQGENALCDLCWAASQEPDEWDATVASAVTGKHDDYSYLDDEAEEQ